MIKKILSLLVVSSLYAGESDDLVINSDKVNIANNDKVIFSENISIDSGLVLINADMAISVSYTHLTLPTNREV